VATDLNPQGSAGSVANSINNLGQIVGGSSSLGATLWNNDLATQLTSPEGSNNSWAISINDLGQIIGGFYTADLMRRPILWNNGVATDITPQGSIESVASSINNAGQIVGFSSNSSYDTRRATLWNDGVAFDLNSFLSASDQSEGWVLTDARDINNNGSIIGQAYNPLLGIPNQTFLLQSISPVPEADTSAMLLTGLGLIGFMARRRKNTQA
jgi:probable HAF family extracellular repeat protein